MGTQSKRPMAVILAVILCLSLTGCMAVSAATVSAGPEASTAIYYMDTLPGNWSIESAQTPEKEYLRDLTTTALYRAEDGEVAPELAALPEDVTQDYYGTYGIPTDAQRGYAFRISLDEQVFWENGTAVTADDVLFAVEKMLLSESCSQDYLWIAGAEEFTAGWERETDNVISLEEAGFDSVTAAGEAGYHRFYVDMEHFWGLEAGWGSTMNRTRVQDYAMPTGLNEMYLTSGYLYNQYLADGMGYDHLQAEFVGISAEPENRMTMEDVGILKTGEHEFVVIAGEPVTASVAAARLSKLCLFAQELYNEAYGTSTETYSSYGPYRVVSAGAEEIALERNPYWQGDTGAYPADRIVCLPR